MSVNFASIYQMLRGINVRAKDALCLARHYKSAHESEPEFWNLDNISNFCTPHIVYGLSHYVGDDGRYYERAFLDIPSEL